MNEYLNEYVRYNKFSKSQQLFHDDDAKIRFPTNDTINWCHSYKANFIYGVVHICFPEKILIENEEKLEFFSSNIYPKHCEYFG